MTGKNAVRKFAHTYATISLFQFRRITSAVFFFGRSVISNDKWRGFIIVQEPTEPNERTFPVIFVRGDSEGDCDCEKKKVNLSEANSAKFCTRRDTRDVRDNMAGVFFVCVVARNICREGLGVERGWWSATALRLNWENTHKKNMSAVFRQRARENGRAHYLVVSFVQDGVCVCGPLRLSVRNGPQLPRVANFPDILSGKINRWPGPADTFGNGELGGKCVCVCALPGAGATHPCGESRVAAASN